MDMLASRPSKRSSGAFKSMTTRQTGPLPVCPPRHESSARLPRRRRTRRHPLSVTSVIREKAPREGKIGTTATKVAGGLESASYYLQEKKFEHLGEDFKGLVRRYPLRSLLIGLGLGFLLVGRK